jgi:hypothetical protein
MAVKLNQTAVDFAKELIRDGKYTHDEMGDWSEHQPSTDDENAFIEEHGIEEYAKWHLGTHDEHPADTKGHYAFPIGDFKKIHRCGVIAAEVRAAEYKHDDIEHAAAHLHGMLDGADHRHE